MKPRFMLIYACARNLAQERSENEMLERDIENWLNRQIESMGGLALKFVSPGNPGVPDRIYILPNGRVWFVELKQQLGKVAKIQKWQRQRLLSMGCNYRLVRGMEDAKAYAEEMRHEIQSA